MTTKGISRRGFMHGAAAGVGGLLAAKSAVASADTTNGAVTMPKAVLGRTGVEVSRLGVGCGQWRRAHITPDDAVAMVHRALELGVNYLDTAPNYARDGEVSEEKLGAVVNEVREKVFLVSKTEEATYEGTWDLLRQSLRRMKTDYIDLVHLHNIGREERFPDMDFMLSDKGALGALREAKKQGVIRYIGASGHVWPARFHQALDTGEIDVLMNSVNFIVQHTYDFENKIWSRAREDNIGLVAMKVLGGGGPGDRGFRMDAEFYDKAIRYALGIPGCAVAVIGLDKLEHLEQAAHAVATYEPLSDTERFELAKAGLDMAQQESWQAPYGRPLA